MRKQIIMATTILSLLTATPVSAQQENTHTHRKYHGVMSDYFYDRLAQCETGGKWDHSTRSYTGGLGIARGTWIRWSNSTSARGKTPEYQVQIADNIAFLGHTTDGVYKYPVGPFGWGCVRRTHELQTLLCKSNNKIVRYWRRNC